MSKVTIIHGGGGCSRSIRIIRSRAKERNRTRRRKKKKRSHIFFFFFNKQP